MAYGFGTAFGTATTDQIAWLANTASTVLSTYTVWVNRHGHAGTYGRIVDTGPLLLVSLIDVPGYYDFVEGNWTTAGRWRFPMANDLDTWKHLAITYNAGALANDPVIYADGVSVLVQRITAPTGTYAPAGVPWVLGNRAAADRHWDGKLAEFARWARLLSAGQIATLAAGTSPVSLTPAGFDRVSRLRNSVVELVTSEVGTVTGALVQADHPPFIAALPGAYVVTGQAAGTLAPAGAPSLRKGLTTVGAG